jgi:hypothetical protein
MPAMTDGDQTVSKHAPLPTPFLSEQMTVAHMLEVLEALQFDSRYGEAKLLIDPGVRDYLVRATKAAAADHLDQKVRHTWRLIKPR